MNPKILSAALALILATPLAQAGWQTLFREADKRVEIDPVRVSLGETGKANLWSRLVLASPATDPVTGKSFVAVEMLSRFDCDNRRVATLERVLVDEHDRVLRDERLAAPKDSSIAVGALDERLFGVACKRSPEAVAQMAERAAAADPASQGKLSRADLRGMAGARLVPVNAEEHAAPEKKAVPDKIQLPIKKPLNPEVLPTPAKKGLVNPEAPPAAHKAAEAAGHGDKSLEKAAEKLAEKAEKPAHAEISARPPIQEYLPPRRAKRHVVHHKPKAKAKTEKIELVHGADHGPDLHASGAHWTYDGETGPANWGKMSPGYASCDWGTRQSPIDIRDGVKVDLPEIKFDYRPSQFSIVDNGHTVQVTYGDGSSSVTVQGRRYELVQFHFHKPAEERINGRVYDMVVHLVHKDDEGHLAVVAVLMERGEENAFIQSLWNNLPLEPHSVVQPPDVAIDLMNLLPTNRSYYTYMGSLTTPPCTEGVLWMVMKTPVKISQEQIGIFSRLYRNNARPIQKTLGRLVKESR